VDQNEAKYNFDGNLKKQTKIQVQFDEQKESPKLNLRSKSPQMAKISESMLSTVKVKEEPLRSSSTVRVDPYKVEK
jgi:hypothetical protein